MNDELHIGVLLPTGKAQWGEGADPRQLFELAVRAEELGFASVWVNDTLLSPRIEGLSMLAALAPLTNRIKLGTATLMPVLRRPIQAAQTIASVDLLSGGRAGFPGRLGQPLYELSEVPWARRFERLDETVALWRHLWATPGPSSSTGDYCNSTRCRRRRGHISPTDHPSGWAARRPRRRPARGAATMAGCHIRRRCLTTQPAGARFAAQLKKPIEAPTRSRRRSM